MIHYDKVFCEYFEETTKFREGQSKSSGGGEVFVSITQNF